MIRWPLAFLHSTHILLLGQWHFFQIIKCLTHAGGTYVSLSFSQSWEILSCCRIFLVEIAFGLTLGFFVQSDEATGVVPFVVFILVWRMPFGLAQS